MTAYERIMSKALVGSGLDSYQWNMVDAGFRDRSFFSATVEDLRIVGQFRSGVADLVRGGRSPSETRRDIRAFLDSIGYAPDEKHEGTIKDLRSKARLDVMMRTNADQAKGYVSHLRATTPGALLAFPAYELVRVQNRKLKRDWSSRWLKAAQGVGWEGVSKHGGMVALKTSPIWLAISAFGNPYPPFDYNSGMGIRDVAKSKCREIGLLGENEQPKLPETPGFNDHLQATVPHAEENARFVRQRLGDLGEVFGSTVRFVTPDWSKAVSLPSPSGLVTVSPKIAFKLPKELLPLLPALVRAGEITTADGRKMKASVNGERLEGVSVS